MSATGIHTWQEIQTEVRRRIHARIWQPGEMIPNESDLATEFGCARATVNRAMRELADAGLLDRRRKGGTRVALNPIRKATLEIPITRLEVERRGAVWRHVILERSIEQPPAAVAKRLDLANPVLHLRSLHFADDRPFLLEDRLINTVSVPAILEQDFSDISANEWLVQNAPFTAGEIAFSAASASAEEAGLLEIPAGSALFIVDRTTWNGAVPITSVRLAYQPGYRMHTSL